MFVGLLIFFLCLAALAFAWWAGLVQLVVELACQPITWLGAAACAWFVAGMPGL